MTTIITRLTGGTAKNAPLTNTELDNNFINLNTDKIETADAVSANTANKVVKRDSNGDFSAGNITLSGTGAIKVPSGTTLQQPTPTAGMIRFNSDTGFFEAYRASTWTTIDDAVSTNTANKIVKRDGSGDFAANNLTLSGTGAIKVPSGTTLQQPTPTAGMIRFNSDTASFEGYKSGAWSSIGGGGAVGAVIVGVTNDVFYENSKIVTASYTITSGKNAMTTGPITINSLVVVTVPSGSRWVIL